MASGHRGIAGVVRMDVIAAVEVRMKPRRLLRVARGGIEIRHGIELAAGPNPLVDGLAHRLGLGVVQP